jgi:hypothetical protein
MSQLNTQINNPPHSHILETEHREFLKRMAIHSTQERVVLDWISQFRTILLLQWTDEDGQPLPISETVLLNAQEIATDIMNTAVEEFQREKISWPDAQSLLANMFRAMRIEPKMANSFREKPWMSRMFGGNAIAEYRENIERNSPPEDRAPTSVEMEPFLMVMKLHQ